MLSRPRARGVLFSLLLASKLIATTCARETAYIDGIGIDGQKRSLDVSRQPALFTGDFGDCLAGGSLFNITEFDAAYYADNLTVLFHIIGSSNIRDESLMMHISVEAYGENRFNMTYDPCKANIASLCPLNSSVPIEAFAAIPISANEVAGIPSIALGIPDLEGVARMRLFANSTQTEIGCFQASMGNGQTFSQPKSVGSVIGAFVFLAVLSSFATAIYGLQIPHMRTHYAHSFSILVIFETFQSIYFSGALSVNWPSVLPAWWTNFAWTTGMFASPSMVRSISPFAGVSGNASQVGGAGSVPINTGGGLTQQIYGRALKSRAMLQTVTSLNSFTRRAEYNTSDPYSYNWAGHPINPGMPLPGDLRGFAGTLSAVGIPERDAFLIGLIWTLVALGAVALFIAAAKLLLELCIKLKLIKTDGFNYFSSHWLGYMIAGLLRTLFISFFIMTTLALFQFSLNAPAGPTAIAAIIFIMFLGFGALAAYACAARLRDGKYEVVSDTLRFEEGKLFKKLPWVAATFQSSIGEEEQAQKPRLFGSIPLRRIKFTDNDPNRTSVHQDETYIKRFGWLSARYRRTRWWFFGAYLAYQFTRACFIGGASRNPLAQVYGLFVFEVFALVAIIKLKPFEAARNTTVAIWLLSISKIVTTGLSIAFLPSFNLNRILATVFGIIIIVVQGFLAVAVLVLIILGMFSTWLSLSRNREEFPEKLDGTRIRYFEHIAARAGDLPPQPKVVEEPPEPIKPSFNVGSVRRISGVQRPPTITESNENDNIFPTLDGAGYDATQPTPVDRRSRANSASSRYSVSSLPRSGRTHRASWSAKDFAEWDADMNRGDTARVSRVRSSSLRLQAARHSLQRPPMTPARESAEFIRFSDFAPQPESKDAITEDDLEKTNDTPRKRGTVNFAEDPTEDPATLGLEPTQGNAKAETVVPERN